MTIRRHITLNDTTVPTFLYGTAWKEERTEACVRKALHAGFRGLDTANQRKHYVEAGVGAALREAYDAGLVRREEIFLQTKFTYRAGQDARVPYDADADLPTQVRQSCASSLEHLGAEYLDSYVLHGPSARSTLTDDDWQVWQTMEELRRSGRVRLLGVSNVAVSQLEMLWDHCSVKPSVVQNRCFAATRWDGKVRAFCRDKGILYQGFSLLTANTHIVENPDFQRIASRHCCSPAQLIFSFALHAGMAVLTGTADFVHMQDDLAVYNLRLDPDETKRIETIGA